MPSEQARSSKKQQQQSLENDETLNARQSCTYSSIVSVDRTNYPFFSSYEHEQTWILTRTMSNHRKRYQSSIDNIHLTMPRLSSHSIPSVFDVVKSLGSERATHGRNSPRDHLKLVEGRSIPFSLSTSASQRYTSASSRRKHSIVPMNLHAQEMTSLPVQIETDGDSYSTATLDKPMRVMHANGEFSVRI